MIYNRTEHNEGSFLIRATHFRFPLIPSQMKHQYGCFTQQSGFHNIRMRDLETKKLWSPLRIQMKTSRGLICDPKKVWFSSLFSLGIKTHARDEFGHFFYSLSHYELLMSFRTWHSKCNIRCRHWIYHVNFRRCCIKTECCRLIRVLIVSLTCLMYDNTNCPTRTLMDNSGQKSLYEGRMRWNERDLTKSACFRVVCISNGAGRNYK